MSLYTYVHSSPLVGEMLNKGEQLLRLLIESLHVKSAKLNSFHEKIVKSYSFKALLKLGFMGHQVGISATIGYLHTDHILYPKQQDQSKGVSFRVDRWLAASARSRSVRLSVSFHN